MQPFYRRSKGFPIRFHHTYPSSFVIIYPTRTKRERGRGTAERAPNLTRELIYFMPFHYESAGARERAPVSNSTCRDIRIRFDLYRRCREIDVAKYSGYQPSIDITRPFHPSYEEATSGITWLTFVRGAAERHARKRASMCRTVSDSPLKNRR